MFYFAGYMLSKQENTLSGHMLVEMNQRNNPQALIIDDEADICYLLKDILKHKNIEAAYATTLAEAKQILQQYELAVIFLDNHLADGFGMDYIRHFKKEYPFSKIVMITAHDNFSDRQKAYREGVDFFISKPFTRDTILKAIEKIM